MIKVLKIAVLVGSIRKDSINRKLANALIEIAPESLKLELAEIGHLPLYDADTDDRPPPAWTEFRKKIAAADAIMFVTPEYNGSMPGPLKNAIDGGAPSHSQNIWNGKPAAVLSASESKDGSYGSNIHLQESLVSLVVPVMLHPDGYIGEADKLFDGSGKLVNADARAFLKKYLQAFLEWIDTQGDALGRQPDLRPKR